MERGRPGSPRSATPLMWSTPPTVPSGSRRRQRCLANRSLPTTTFEVDETPMLGRPVVGWVGGGETVAERDHLAAFDTPGISVGSPVEGLGDSSNPTITPVPSSWSDQCFTRFAASRPMSSSNSARILLH